MSACAFFSSRTFQLMKSTISGWSMSRHTILAARRVVPPLLVAPAARSNTSRKLMSPLDVPPPESFSSSRRCSSRCSSKSRQAEEALQRGLLHLQDVAEAHVVLDQRDDLRGVVVGEAQARENFLGDADADLDVAVEADAVAGNLRVGGW